MQTFQAVTNLCGVCGMKVEEGSDFERLGKHFCSEDHAERYARKTQSGPNQEPAAHHCGC